VIRGGIKNQKLYLHFKLNSLQQVQDSKERFELMMTFGGTGVSPVLS
jgi:hypothetical protein